MIAYPVADVRDASNIGPPVLSPTRVARRGAITPALYEEVLASDYCHYCDGPVSEVDHIIPWSRGGSDERENLAPACGPCNREKSDQTPDEWRGARLAAGKPWPPPSSFDVLTDLVPLVAPTDESLRLLTEALVAQRVDVHEAIRRAVRAVRAGHDGLPHARRAVTLSRQDDPALALAQDHVDALRGRLTEAAEMFATDEITADQWRRIRTRLSFTIPEAEKRLAAVLRQPAASAR